MEPLPKRGEKERGEGERILPRYSPTITGKQYRVLVTICLLAVIYWAAAPIGDKVL